MSTGHAETLAGIAERAKAIRRFETKQIRRYRADGPLPAGCHGWYKVHESKAVLASVAYVLFGNDRGKPGSMLAALGLEVES